MAAAGETRNPSPPPYPEMILGAIEALKEKNGCNKTKILKYIESNYETLPAGHSTLLSQHLNKMKDNGELVFWKNNYTKADPNAPPRRGRGRPPKDKSRLPKSAAQSPGRPRGRAHKDPNSSGPSNKSKGSRGRPRGRPRKMAPSGVVGGSKPRGRPPKAKAQRA